MTASNSLLGKGIVNPIYPFYHPSHNSPHEPMVLGYLIEYAVYPIPYMKLLQEKDLKEGKRVRTRMLATGRIIFDRLGTVRKLQVEARKLLRKKFPIESREQLEMRKYYLWDQLDNLRDLVEQNSPGFTYAYYAGLQEILWSYAAFVRLEIPRPARVHAFLTDGEFRERYSIASLSDSAFSCLFEKAMREPSMQMIERLTLYVHERMGGFSINGWTLRGKVP